MSKNRLNDEAKQENLTGAIAKASPELYQQLVDWAARWKSRLSQEGRSVEPPRKEVVGK